MKYRLVPSTGDTQPGNRFARTGRLRRGQKGQDMPVSGIPQSGMEQWSLDKSRRLLIVIRQELNWLIGGVDNMVGLINTASSVSHEPEHPNNKCTYITLRRHPHLLFRSGLCARLDAEFCCGPAFRGRRLSPPICTFIYCLSPPVLHSHELGPVVLDTWKSP